MWTESKLENIIPISLNEGNSSCILGATVKNDVKRICILAWQFFHYSKILKHSVYLCIVKPMSLNFLRCLALVITMLIAACKKDNNNDLATTPPPQAVHAAASVLVIELDIDNHVKEINTAFYYNGESYAVNMDPIYDEDRNSSIEIANTDLMSSTNDFYFPTNAPTMILFAPHLPNRGQPDQVRTLFQNISKELNDDDSIQSGNQHRRFRTYIPKPYVSS